MAIIRPNTRNAFGVPARYSDLASAGLRWTPPPVYRCDAYDVQGNTATLFQQGIDLDDYQYNYDSYNAVVLPDGYTAITGNASGASVWSYLIGPNDKLCIWDQGGIGEIAGSPSGITRVAYSGGGQALIIVNGDLVFCWPANGSLIQYTVDNTRTWTEITFNDGINDERAAAVGIADGKLMAVVVIINDFRVFTLSNATGWKIAGGVYEWLDPALGWADSFDGQTNFVISAAGRLHLVNTMNGIPSLSEELASLGDGWTDISGYVQAMGFQGSGPYYEDSYIETHLMYGIRAGRLHSLGVSALNKNSPSTTQITEFTDWHRVVFIAPDEAVAIRRVTL